MSVKKNKNYNKIKVCGKKRPNFAAYAVISFVLQQVGHMHLIF